MEQQEARKRFICFTRMPECLDYRAEGETVLLRLSYSNGSEELLHFYRIGRLRLPRSAGSKKYCCKTAKRA
jgi:hypothetical protein